MSEDTVTDVYRKLATGPIQLLPNRVWRTYQGGRMIAEWQCGIVAEDGPYPEDWVASVVHAHNVGREDLPDEGVSQVEVSPGRFMGLDELIAHDPVAFLGSDHVQRYGCQTALLVKILDASERLTLQVHPDRAFAKKHFHSLFGKTEAWYVLDGRVVNGQRPCVYMGFKPGVTREVWRRLFEDQDITGMLDALHKIPVNAGDVIIVHAGMPHAIGQGCFLVEIQEPTDYTLRVERVTPRGQSVPDVACHRGLGFDTMLSCFDYQTYTLNDLRTSAVLTPRVVKDTAEAQRVALIDASSTDRFGMDRVTVKMQYVCEPLGHYSVVVVLEGHGTVRWEDGELPLRRSSCLLLPASVPRLLFTSEGQEPLSMLFCHPPSGQHD